MKSLFLGRDSGKGGGERLSTGLEEIGMDSCQVVLLPLNTPQLIVYNMFMDTWRVLYSLFIQRHHDKADGWDVHMQMQVAHCGFLTNRSALRWSPYLLRHGSSRVACKIFFRSFLNTSVSRCCCWNTWSHVAGNTATFWARYPAPLNLATLILGHCRVEVRRGVENTPEEVQSSTLGQDLQDHEECVQFALKLEPWSLAQFFENL